MAIWTIAKTTVGEQMRKKVLNVCLIVAVAMIVLALSFTQFAFKQDMTMVKSFGLSVIWLAGAIISLLLCVGLIPNEVDRRTIYTILSKPVNRYEFVVGKFIGGLLTLLINIGIMGAAFILVVTIKAYFSSATVGISHAGVADAASVSGVIKPQIFDPSLVTGVAMLYFQFMLLSAVVMMFSVFLTPTVNFFASAGVYIVGLMAPMWESMTAKTSQAGPAVKVFYKIVHTVIPNFDYFNIHNKLVHPQIEVRSIGAYTAETIAYALVFSSVLMIVAVLLFERKEV